MKNRIEKGHIIPQTFIQTYKTLLPDELIEMGEKYGFTNLLEGYLKVINPEEYQELLDETYFRGKVSIPILRKH